MRHYDYIIAGAGCAGLSLATRMAVLGVLKNKKILLVDKAPKTANDRTWCFWETDRGFFEPVVYKTWQKLNFYSNQSHKILDISPYKYKMIRGIDFYKYCFKLLEKEQVDVIYDEVESITSEPAIAHLTLKNQTFSADYIFSSIMNEKLVKQAGKHYLWQHFKGLIVETTRDHFNVDVATLMDFRISQNDAANFVYLLPLTKTEAMVEYTAFSSGPLDEKAYDAVLSSYLESHITDVRYSIKAEERGSIPMTNHHFPSQDNRIFYIGTAGGTTKPSSGYTFQFIQAQSGAIIRQLILQGFPETHKKVFDRFLWYDSIMLRVLLEGKVSADKIFDRLFCKNDTQKVLKFLDNATTLSEELKLIGSLPTLPFLSAALREANPFH